MPMLLNPVVGDWFRDTDEDETFEVTHFDEENGLIEIEYEDGELEEITVDAWKELNLVGIENPDDDD